jgi:hypothetical protein
MSKEEIEQIILESELNDYDYSFSSAQDEREYLNESFLRMQKLAGIIKG